MAYELIVKVKGQEKTFTRNEPPMVENLLDALKVQRIDTERFADGSKPPSDKLQKDWLDALLQFAVNFWGDGLTKKDLQTGLPAKDIEVISQAVIETLGYGDDSDDEEEINPKG